MPPSHIREKFKLPENPEEEVEARAIQAPPALQEQQAPLKAQQKPHGQNSSISKHPEKKKLTIPETRLKTKNKVITKNQIKISEAFEKVVNKKEDLPSKVNVRQMWKDLEKQAILSEKSEIKKEKLENPTKTEPETKENKIKNKPENRKQQQQINNNKNKQNNVNKQTNSSTTTTTLEQKKRAKPNSKLSGKGKQISDIETLRDFLAKKKLERAERGKFANIAIEASHTVRSEINNQRDQPTNIGEPGLAPHREKEGLEMAAKGDTV